ncbi:hypothetical protein BCR44DRAFT_51516 [Catenaria anguillulae PL171]|uniref:Uncharacterized protein n=1 Tax=Catenaria anguillulae PL171 TaxID=765915 RepID=A0A1Y2HPZ9_9FUNG|nr:hypothetical protein BCR44DRAFT_51516 [Catenaria anguillulae PL171]
MPTQASSSPTKREKIPSNCVPGISIRPGTFLCIFLILVQFIGAAVTRLLLSSSPILDLSICAVAIVTYLALARAAWMRNAQLYKILEWVAFVAYVVVTIAVIYPSLMTALEKAGSLSLEYPLLAASFVVNLGMLYQMQRYAVVLEHEDKVKSERGQGVA